MTDKHKFRVVIKPEALLVALETVFDPPENFAFESRERAQGWCDGLNRHLGYERFHVVLEGEHSSEGGSASRAKSA
jgi:hypothetical protein